MRGFPPASAGMTVGLLGGSFDPAHPGHVHLTEEALRRFDLDRVWWLVSPGNPLKARGPAPLAQRMAGARALMRHPRVEITDIEARLGTRHTAAMLARLMPLYPGVRFVWLMGADNLASFHRWDRWRWIMGQVPVGVIARPGNAMAALGSPAARFAARWRLPAAAAPLLARRGAPRWCYLTVPLVGISSTELRARGGGAPATPLLEGARPSAKVSP
ncbi:nicotinate-nucleotide adenylyltransferase [Halodurantibacterium flavum]|uniref:Probable nicotinate-nucleotide adenylyltransferase n=1 Tax=Halodurantibacterium flavum TaxID=1382802 RepID=A0ABW4S1G3_9RHOB